MTITVDGIDYAVTAKKITRKAVPLDKSAERTASGDLNRELIGIFLNYVLEINYTQDAAAYDAFWNKLTEAVEFHTITVPTEGGSITFTAYIAGQGVTDEIFMTTIDGLHHWQNLSFEFIAKSPWRVPA